MTRQHLRDSWLSALRYCSTSLAQCVQALRERNTGEARGSALLREWLTVDQRVQFDAGKSFDVIGCHSGKRYRINYGSVANVHEIDGDGRPLVRWCFVPVGHLVAGDVMLAQKIALETNEIATMAVANRCPTQLPNFNVALLAGQRVLQETDADALNDFH